MLNSVDFSGRPFHFIGIGGIGMSALAYVLAKRKLPVSGSDLRLSHITQRLKENGAHIFWTQDAANLSFFTHGAAISPHPEVSESDHPSQFNGVSNHQGQWLAQTAVALLEKSQLPQVVCSTAINPNNPEYRAAVELGCPIFHRSDILAALMAEYKGIAVAGTHGKTTTSSMVGHLLVKTGVDPTIVIGGEVGEWQGNAYVGQSDYMVAEADESDGSLAKLSAYIGVITNIELDHPDHYSTLDEVVDIFKAFSKQCQITVGCLDCPTIKSELSPTVTYSLLPNSGADYIAQDIRQSPQGMIADIWERGTLLGQLHIPQLGLHNLSNALAAVAVGRLVALEFDAIADALATFGGARRRFDRRGFYNDILFVDDYAHHPSEIRVTLAAARLQSTEVLPSGVERRVVAIFQPHRYSRAATLLDEFASAFGDADQVIVSDIYAASETNHYGISGQQVADAIAQHHSQVDYQPTLEDIQSKLADILRPGDIALFLTAGNLNRIIPDVMDGVKTRPGVEVLSNA
ncbi:MAG: UDP-N-acetylmuramate--L-alanine ligase [Cyanobacteria bacterium P01_D01_bin.44]